MAAMGSSKRFVLILSAQKPLVTFLLAHKAKDKCRRSVIIMLCCQKIAFVQGGGCPHRLLVGSHPPQFIEGMLQAGGGEK